MKIKLYIVLLLISSNIYFAQKTRINYPYINSIKAVVKSEKNIQKKCNFYNRIAEEFLSIYSIDSVKYYSNNAIKIAKENDLEKEAGIAYKNIAKTSSFNFDKRGYIITKKDCYENLNKAIAIFSKLNENNELAECFYYLAKYYLEYHNLELFFSNNSKAVFIYESIKDSLGLAKCLTQKAKVLAIKKNYDLAEHLFKLSYRIFKERKDTLALISILSNYSYLCKDLNDKGKQLSLLEEATLLADKTDSKYLKAFAFSDLGGALINNKRGKEALVVLTKALENAEPLQADILMTQICKNISSAYQALGDYNKALEFKDKSFNHFMLYTRKANLEVAESEKYERESELNTQKVQANSEKVTYLAIILIIMLLLIIVVYFQRLKYSRRLESKIKIIDEQNSRLNEVNHLLEEKVSERTIDLTNKNLELKKEIESRKRIESELVVAKQEAEAGNTIKTNLLSNMSHEFRTPLNGILGFVEILKDELDGSVLQEFVNKIERSGKRLLNTLNSVLTIMELTNNNYYSETSVFSLYELCEKMLSKFQNAANSKSINLYLEKASNDLFVVTDKEILMRVVESLLDNAIKYTEKGQVTLRIGLAENEGVIEVSMAVIDTGIGIRDEDKAYLFKEFKQISEGYSREYEGLGLGLALAEKMIKIIKGRLTIESKYKHGSTFTVWFPLERAQEENEQGIFNNETAFKEERNNILTRYKILLVEDNELNAEVAVRFVKPYGAAIDLAKNAIAAIELASKCKYDLLLIDINLGYGMNGIVLLKEIRNMNEYQNIKAIAITGFASSANKKEIDEYGFDGYLPKPFDKKGLISKIFEVLKIE